LTPPKAIALCLNNSMVYLVGKSISLVIKFYCIFVRLMMMMTTTTMMMVMMMIEKGTEKFYE
jgi:hypothetical protein